MEQVLQDMIIALRSSGVRISVSESIDAMHAARLMGYVDKQVLKDSLSAALAKSQLEKEIFDTCFDRFFSADQFLDLQSDSPALLTMEPDQGDAPLTQMLLAGDNAGLLMSMREAAQEIDMKGIRFFTQKSLYIQQILKGMGVEGMERDIRRISQEKDSSSKHKAMALKEAKDFLFENVRDFVEQQFSLFAASATEEMMER